MAATWTGKVKTCVQIGGIIVIYLYYIIMGALANGIAFADGDGVTAVMFIPHADGMPLLLTIVGWVPFTPAMIISRRTGISSRTAR